MQKQFNINLLGHSITIEQTNLVHEFDKVGRASSHVNKLMIAQDVPDSCKNETLLHEVIHFISYKLGLELNESQISALGCGLHELLENNIATIQDLYTTTNESQ